MNGKLQIRKILKKLKQDPGNPELLEKLRQLSTDHPKTLAKILDKTEKHEQHQQWQNQMATQTVQPLRYFKPTSLFGQPDSSIVGILEQALESGSVVKAAGSGHSYSDIATTPDFFIDTHSFGKTAYTGGLAGQLSLQMLKEDALPLITSTPHTWNGGDPDDNLALFEIEAGITIANLNPILEKLGVGLRNMGGYDGQTLAGVVSTSTHGSGITLSSFSDMVRSIVIATTGKWHGTVIGGTQNRGAAIQVYRIEPSNGITNPVTYNDDKIQLIQNDDCFYSAICNMGCMGVIYSMVLEVMQFYCLDEDRFLINLKDLMQQLQPNPANPGHLPDWVHQTRNIEFLIHPYPMKNGKVIYMDLTKSPSVYYENFNCLVTKRNITPCPHNPKERKNHRKILTQILAKFGLAFKTLAHLLNKHPHLVPSIINMSLKGLVDTNYINKYYHVYDLGLNQDSGFATEIGFALEDENGNYTPAHFKAAIDRIHRIAQHARQEGQQYQTSAFSLRFVKKSTAYLSMMHGVNTAMIEMDMLTGTFGGIEVMLRYQKGAYDLGGKPHWGLEFDHLTGSNNLLQQMYPKFDEWMQVYNQFNSKGTFNNSTTDRLGFSKTGFKRKQNV